MRKYLFTMLIVTTLGSCVSLDEERILLNEKGSIKGDSLEKVLINPEKGVHYVFVDTADKELLIRYESEVSPANYITSIRTQLEAEGLLFVPVVDTVEVIQDTIVEQEIVVEEEVPVVAIPVTAPIVVVDSVIETITPDSLED